LTLLSDVEIERRLNDGSLVLRPFDQLCLNGAGYDLRAGMNISIPPGEYRLVATLERVELGDDLAGTLHVRSSLGRVGIIASLALIDPGFRGQLTISLFNAGKDEFSLRENDRFLQMVLHQLSSRTTQVYSGRYQDSQGIVDRRA
jgi:dCTP deaminase